MSKEEHEPHACCGACSYAALVASNPSLEPIERMAPQIEGDSLAIEVSRRGGAVERVARFSQPRVTVGRVVGNDLVLPSATVSKKTCALFFDGGALFVEDLMSSCGTYINGRSIREPTPLHQGDRVYVGDYVLAVSAR